MMLFSEQNKKSEQTKPSEQTKKSEKQTDKHGITRYNVLTV